MHCLLLLNKTKGGKMKMKKRFNQVLSIAVLLCLLLTACSTPAKDEGDKDAKKDGDKPLIGVLFR